MEKLVTLNTNPLLLPSHESSLDIFNTSSSFKSNVDSLRDTLDHHDFLPDDGDDAWEPFKRACFVCWSMYLFFNAMKLIVLGPLRASEQQHLKQAFVDYLVQKSLLILFVLTDTRADWAIWFTELGTILLLSKLCKDRFEYLSSSPTVKRWSLVKIGILMLIQLVNALVCLITTLMSDLTTNSLYQLADSAYVLTFVISVITRFILLTYDLGPNSALENTASISYYTDSLFSMSISLIELLHYSHLLLVRHNIFIRAFFLMKINTLLLELHRLYKRHKHYSIIVQYMEKNFEIATQKDIEDFSDECAICWDNMESARKLPCGHLFHKPCLRSWLEQDQSCPTCRTSFKFPQQHHNQHHNINHHQQQDDLSIIADDQSESEDDLIETVRNQHRNNFFRFDSSRYTNYPFLNWLPTISIEGFI